MQRFLIFFCIFFFFCSGLETLRKLYTTNVATVIAAYLNIFLKCEMIYRTAYSTNQLISTVHMDHGYHSLQHDHFAQTVCSDYL